MTRGTLAAFFLLGLPIALPAPLSAADVTAPATGQVFTVTVRNFGLSDLNDVAVAVSAETTRAMCARFKASPSDDVPLLMRSLAIRPDGR